MNSIMQKLVRISMLYLWMMYNTTTNRQNKVVITLFTKRRALSTFFGLTRLHWDRWVMAEKMIFICGNCWWRSRKSCLIAATSLTLLTLPRSFPPQWINRTSGITLPRRHWKRKGIRFCQTIPPLPNHWTCASRPRLVPMVSLARASPRRM